MLLVSIENSNESLCVCWKATFKSDLIFELHEYLYKKYLISLGKVLFYNSKP